MAEVLGAVASATQLASVCFTLLNQLKRIKGASSTLSKYRQQLLELHNISDSISINPLLQTPEIETQTQALVSLIQDNCLYSLLRRGKFWRSIGFAYRERDLFDVLTDLERQKATLSLVIENIQARTLYQIHQDLANMADTPSPASPSMTKDAAPPMSAKNLANVANTSSPRSSSMTDYVAPPTSAGPSTAVVWNNNSSQTPYSDAQNLQQFTNMPRPTNTEQNYKNCSAGSRVHQTLGVGFKIDGVLMPSMHTLKTIPGSFTFENCTKTGHGTQVSGVNMEVLGEAKGGILFPEINHRAIGTRAERGNDDTRAGEIETEQYLGGMLSVKSEGQDKKSK